MGLMCGNLHLDVPDWCEPEWRGLLEACLEPNPAARPSMRELARQLEAIRDDEASQAAAAAAAATTASTATTATMATTAPPLPPRRSSPAAGVAAVTAAAALPAMALFQSQQQQQQVPVGASELQQQGGLSQPASEIAAPLMFSQQQLLAQVAQQQQLQQQHEQQHECIHLDQVAQVLLQQQVQHNMASAAALAAAAPGMGSTVALLPQQQPLLPISVGMAGPQQHLLQGLSAAQQCALQQQHDRQTSGVSHLQST